MQTCPTYTLSYREKVFFQLYAALDGIGMPDRNMALFAASKKNRPRIVNTIGTGAVEPIVTHSAERRETW